ncbi:MAG: universal stress protein [Paracoccaceae bacterium]|nr:universal stress protein [Paracoccaceae bacterium]
MFRHIMVPVDLLHSDTLDRAIEVAAEEARLHDARATFVSVTAQGPTRVADSPDDFRAKLERFAEQKTRKHGVYFAPHPIFSNDPTTDVDDRLLAAVESLDVDLVVMASHKPGFAEYFWPSNGGKIASHSGASVFLVREPD